MKWSLLLQLHAFPLQKSMNFARNYAGNSYSNILQGFSFFKRTFTLGIFHQTSSPKSPAILGLEIGVEWPGGFGGRNSSWCNFPESVMLLYLVSSDVKLGCDIQIIPSCYWVILCACNTTAPSPGCATSTKLMEWQKNKKNRKRENKNNWFTYKAILAMSIVVTLLMCITLLPRATFSQGYLWYHFCGCSKMLQNKQWLIGGKWWGRRQCSQFSDFNYSKAVLWIELLSFRQFMLLRPTDQWWEIFFAK